MYTWVSSSGNTLHRDPPCPWHPPQCLPRERFSGVLDMFSSSEVKVLYPT
jgi:hypothetical protein